MDLEMNLLIEVVQISGFEPHRRGGNDILQPDTILNPMEYMRIFVPFRFV